MENLIAALVKKIALIRQESGLAVNLEVDCMDFTKIMYRLSIPIYKWRSYWATNYDYMFWKAGEFISGIMNGSISKEEWQSGKYWLED